MNKKIVFAALAIAAAIAIAIMARHGEAVVANVAWGRAAELPEELFGIEVASLNSTGQWVNVKHKDWKWARVVRGASGRAECIVLRSRDLSQEWDSKSREELIRDCQSELPAVRAKGTLSISRWTLDPMRRIWAANSGLAGEFHFKECDDNQKVLDLSVRLMNDDEWAAWVKENGEPPPQVPQATEFPDKLLGVKIPKVAPPGATLLGGCIEVGGVKVRYWREDCVPLDHPLFTHSYAEYSLRTKTISGIAFGRNYPMSLSNEERKAAEDEVLKLARADGFDCDGAVDRVSADSEPGEWRFRLDAVRPDGISLSVYVWRRPEEVRKRFDLPDECELRAVVSISDGLFPKIRTSRLWREGQEEPSTEESK